MVAFKAGQHSSFYRGGGGEIAVLTILGVFMVMSYVSNIQRRILDGLCRVNMEAPDSCTPEPLNP